MSGRIERKSLFAPGSFTLGCNYWASHAGIRMWRDWDVEIVRADLRLLVSAGIEVVRVFPLWPDFQPVVALRGGRGRIKGYTVATAANPDERRLSPRDDGVDPVMLDRLEALAESVHSEGLTMIVALVTGWMSGRLFVPPAVEGLNPLRDAEAIRWEVKLVRSIVRRLRDHDAVAAWDLGNECNVMGSSDPASSWVWTSAIAGAIGAVDASRPIVSGMHGLSTSVNGAFTIAGQAELVDVLTTHPYPLFTPHCARERLDSFRPMLHPAAETRLYGDLGGAEAFAEETGSLGPMVSGEGESADFAFVAALSLWVYDCRSMMWWCGFDFDRLGYPPYECDPVERELGLFTSDGDEKPVVASFRGAKESIARISGGVLPPRIVEAVCVLPGEGEWWGAAYSVFLLALQAGFDVRYVTDGEELPDAKIYLLPSMRFAHPYTRSLWKELGARVEGGATLYLSLDDGIVTELTEVFGVRVAGRFERASSEDREFSTEGSSASFETRGATGFTLLPVGAEVLFRMGNGDPALTRFRLGEGVTFLLGFPLEEDAAKHAGFFESSESCDLYRIYRELGDTSTVGRVLTKSSPFLGVTEHPLSEGERIAVCINYARESVRERLHLAAGWAAAPCTPTTQAVESDGHLEVEIPPFEVAAWRLTMDPGVAVAGE